MDSHWVFTLMLVGVSIPLSYFALWVAARIAGVDYPVRGRLVRWAAGLFALVAVLLSAYLPLVGTEGMELPLFAIISAFAAGVFMIVVTTYATIAIRRAGPAPLGLALNGALIGSMAFLLLVSATGFATFLVAGAIGSARHQAAMGEYYAASAGTMSAELAKYNFPLPDAISKTFGDGANSNFAFLEEHPNLQGTEATSWHTRYPPEYSYAFECGQTPLELSREFAAGLKQAGYKVYLDPEQAGGSAGTEWFYVAGYRDGVYVQYRSRENYSCNAQQAGSLINLMVWQKYANEIHALAQEQLQKVN